MKFIPIYLFVLLTMFGCCKKENNVSYHIDKAMERMNKINKLTKKDSIILEYILYKDSIYNDSRDHTRGWKKW